MTGRPEPLNLAARALAMPLETVADILTWTEEPELIQRPGEPVPVFDPLDVAAAQLANAWAVARILNGEPMEGTMQ